ncbi:MAG TPA: alkaline phosphatase family protein [Candidatus Binatia bacterium]|jgi:predicted AlkP superfamily phosphohydrolase/phosphomutase
MAEAKRPRIVLIGIDAGTWDLLDPWMAQGLLPNLARLRDGGVYGNLQSTEVSSSPVLWTSIATGKVPDKTGVTWFVRFPNGLGNPVPVDRSSLKTSPLWRILSRRRIDVAVLGWYVTFPAEEVDGRLLTDLAEFGQMPGSAYPETFLWDLAPIPQGQAVAAMPRFMDYPYDPEKAVRKPGEPPSLDFLVFDRFVRAWTRDKFYLDAAERTLSEGPLPEALFLYLRGTDDVQHGFWKFMDPGAFAPHSDADGKSVEGTTIVPPDQVAAFGKVIPRYWQWIDEGVGKVLSHYPASDPPLVIICSDHGAGPAVAENKVDVPEYMHLSGSHRPVGIFIANGPGIRHGGSRGIELHGASVYDIAPTILHALTLPIGKDMDGHVLSSIFEDSVAQRPDETIDTWDTPGSGPPASPEVPAAIDDKIREHLKSLGYIGQ